MTTVVEAALAFDAVDGDDVGVVELGGGLGLLLEPAHHLLVLGGRRAGSTLIATLALEREIVRQEHLAHPPLAEQALDYRYSPSMRRCSRSRTRSTLLVLVGSVPTRNVSAAGRAELLLSGIGVLASGSTRPRRWSFGGSA